MPRSMPIFMSVVRTVPFCRGARSWRRGPGTCARCSHTPGERGAHRGSWSCPSAASAARISEAPARRSPISTSAPWRRVGPEIAGVAAVDDVGPGAHPVELREPLEAVLEDRLVDVRDAGRLGQQHRRRRLEVRREARIRRGLDVARLEPDGRERAAVDLDRVAVARDATRRPARATSRNAPRWSHGAPVERDLAAGHRRRRRRTCRPRSGPGSTRCSAPRRRFRPSTSIVSG